MRTVPPRGANAWTVVAVLVAVATVPRPAAAQGTATISIIVTSVATRSPVPDATVRALPVARSAASSCVTDGDGRCRLAVDAGQVELRVTALGFAPDSRVLSLAPATQTDVAIELHPAAAPLDPVVTIGTRGAERTVSRSAVPVDVLSSELLESTGVDETWQQLQRLVPSVNVPHIPLADNHARPVTLRGLAPHHVLVLVNGKRRHPASTLLAGPSVSSTAFTDLGAIPESAIERIEVLRDGAAAQYGSDAIGGVVNIILKSGARHDVRTTFATVASSEGGRHFTDGQEIGASGALGVSAISGAYLTVSGELRDQHGTNRAYPDRRPQYFTGDPRNDAPPSVSSFEGDGALRSAIAFFNAGTPIGRGVELYAFGGAADREGVSPDAFFRRPLDARTVRALYPDGFLPVIGTGTGDLSLLAGVRSTSRGWRWDVSSGWGRNRVAYSVRNSNNVSLGAASPTQFYAGEVAADQWTSNADASRELRVGTVPVTLAGGVEFRVERYRIGAGDADSWRDGQVPIPDGPMAGQLAPVGAQGMLGFRPTDAISADRQNAAAYLEADSHPFSKLLVQGAVRAEHYSDFGSTTTGKLATRLELVRGLALRGAVSTGFRAPALSQEYFSSTRTVFLPVNGVTTVLTARTFPVSAPEAKLLGATPLRPEKSLNASAGAVLDVPRWPQLTADFYQIAIRDRIALGNVVTDTSIIRLMEENGLRGVGGGSFFTNAIDTRTRGVDVVARHAMSVGSTGVLQLMGGYNHTRTEVTHVLPPPAPLARFGSVLFSRTDRGILEHGQPGETILLNASYGTGPLELDLHEQRSGPTAQLDQVDPAADQVVRASWVTDARIAYRLHPRVQVALSAVNLFDSYPNDWFDFKDGLEAQGASMQGIFRYPGALSPFGMNGRTLYLQLVYR